MRIRPLSTKQARLLILVALVLVVSLPLIHPFQVVTAQNTNEGQYYNTEFAWDYGGNHWVWNLSIPVDLYNAYNAVPDSIRTQISLSHFGYFTTTQDNYIQTLANDLNNSATQLGYNSDDKINFILAFVQSIPYKTDNASTGYQDYPRFPIETIVDNVGDCKSHSVLFATLTLILGYGTVCINPPDHLAVEKVWEIIYKAPTLRIITTHIIMPKPPEAASHSGNYQTNSKAKAPLYTE